MDIVYTLTRNNKGEADYSASVPDEFRREVTQIARLPPRGLSLRNPVDDDPNPTFDLHVPDQLVRVIHMCKKRGFK